MRIRATQLTRILSRANSLARALVIEMTAAPTAPKTESPAVAYRPGVGREKDDRSAVFAQRRQSRVHGKDAGQEPAGERPLNLLRGQVGERRRPGFFLRSRADQDVEPSGQQPDGIEAAATSG